MNTQEAHDMAADVERFVVALGAPVRISYERNGPYVEMVARWDDTDDEVATLKIGPID